MCDVLADLWEIRDSSFSLNIFHFTATWWAMRDLCKFDEVVGIITRGNPPRLNSRLGMKSSITIHQATTSPTDDKVIWGVIRYYSGSLRFSQPLHRFTCEKKIVRVDTRREYENSRKLDSKRREERKFSWEKY